MIGTANRDENLYLLEKSVSNYVFQFCNSNFASSDLWHSRLGNPSF